MAQEKKPQQVRDVMTANPKTVSEKDSVLEVARIMRDKDTGVVPVVDGKKIIGMVTDRDIVVRCVADGKEIKNCTVSDVMTRKVSTVNEEDSMRDVLTVMSSEQVRRVPVVNRNNEIVGIVSMKDLADESSDERKVGQAVEDISRGPANN